MKTALIILDSKAMTFILQKMLEDLGFSVFVRSNLEEAHLLLSQENAPDVVFLDKVFHTETTDSLIRTFNNTKFIYISKETSPEQIQAALDLGVTEYIMKPFDHDILHIKLIELVLSDRCSYGINI